MIGSVNITDPISQGDIFKTIPFLYSDYNNLLVINEDNNQREIKKWNNIISNKINYVEAIIEPVWGIVASQNCDASRKPVIIFFKIDLLSKLTGIDLSKKGNANSRQKSIIENSRKAPNWFYLGKNDDIGFSEWMAVNFLDCFQIKSDFLKNNLNLRVGKLDKVAYEHYRESIAQFYRRYPYNEWYSLTKDEFKEYQNNTSEQIKAYEWQK